jgi:hypothetical protein
MNNINEELIYISGGTQVDIMPCLQVVSRSYRRVNP